MQREIKFKVWDKVTKKMLVNYNLFTFESNFGGVKEEDIEICQYTGLKDKNGKEIYEGDILGKYHFFEDKQGFVAYGQVKFDEELATFCVENSDGTWRSLYEMLNLEIIGNIYENPDLLS